VGPEGGGKKGEGKGKGGEGKRGRGRRFCTFFFNDPYYSWGQGNVKGGGKREGERGGEKEEKGFPALFCTNKGEF